MKIKHFYWYLAVKVLKYLSISLSIYIWLRLFLYSKTSMIDDLLKHVSNVFKSHLYSHILVPLTMME